MSLMRVNKDAAEVFTMPRYSRCSLVNCVSSANSVMPMMPFIGVRISWLILARNSLFARLAPLPRPWRRARGSFFNLFEPCDVHANYDELLGFAEAIKEGNYSGVDPVKKLPSFARFLISPFHIFSDLIVSHSPAEDFVASTLVNSQSVGPARVALRGRIGRLTGTCRWQRL